jgi:hypothetical protein
VATPSPPPDNDEPRQPTTNAVNSSVAKSSPPPDNDEPRQPITNAGNSSVATPSSDAHQHRILLTPKQRKVYRDCLTQDWTAEWCRGHTWGIFSTYDRTYAECVAAQHYGKFVVNGRSRFVNLEGYCWSKARRFAPDIVPLK